MPAILIGIAAALAASALYAVGIALQAVEARVGPAEQALRLSLFRRLVTRPRWLAGTALGLTGWALQALALTRAPLTLVQPLLGASVVFLLGISIWRLGERVGRADGVALAAVIAGVPVLGLTAPHRDADHAAGLDVWLALSLLGAVALSPLLLPAAKRATSMLVPIGAGVAYSWDGLATKFASDDYAQRYWIGLAFWFVAMNAAAGLGTLAEMSALQRRPVVQVVPIVFGLTTFVPVALAPLVAREFWPASDWRKTGLVVGLLLVGGGALTLARAPAVARAFGGGASNSGRETPRSRCDESSRSSVLSELGA